MPQAHLALIQAFIASIYGFRCALPNLQVIMINSQLGMVKIDCSACQNTYKVTPKIHSGIVADIPRVPHHSVRVCMLPANN